MGFDTLVMLIASVEGVECPLIRPAAFDHSPSLGDDQDRGHALGGSWSQEAWLPEARVVGFPCTTRPEFFFLAKRLFCLFKLAGWNATWRWACM